MEESNITDVTSKLYIFVHKFGELIRINFVSHILVTYKTCLEDLPYNIITENCDVLDKVKGKYSTLLLIAPFLRFTIFHNFVTTLYIY